MVGFDSEDREFLDVNDDVNVSKVKVLAKDNNIVRFLLKVFTSNEAKQRIISVNLMEMAVHLNVHIHYQKNKIMLVVLKHQNGENIQ